MRKQSGITLIALIITIIVMLILVAVAVATSLNGGLFTKAKDSSKQTQIEAEKEQLASAAWATIEENGKVDFIALDTNLPEGFTGSNGTYTSKTGNTYIVDVHGNVEYLAISEGAEEIAKIVSEDDEEYEQWKTDGNGTILYYDIQDDEKIPETLIIPCQIGDEKITKIGKAALAGYKVYRDENGKAITEVDEDGVEMFVGDFDPQIGDFFRSRMQKELKKVVISKGIQVIQLSSFESCEDLEEIILPSTITTIENYAFGGCTSLITSIPSGVKEIGYGAFCWCESLEKINLPSKMTIIEGETFAGCSRLKEIIIPEGITLIGNSAFADCESLEIVTIPAGTTEIADSAFERCYLLEEIILQEGLITIGERAFRSCESLKEITIPSTVDNFGCLAFYDTYDGITVYVKGKREAPVLTDNYSGIGWERDWDYTVENIVWDS